MAMDRQGLNLPPPQSVILMYDEAKCCFVSIPVQIVEFYIFLLDPVLENSLNFVL